jgi:CRISPR/Cas system CSM-associated protein Csm3 (group 7 of RAMP superfamily)
MIAGYDYIPESSGGNFLTLKKKGDACKIRLVSTPIHYQKEWEGKKREKFAWVVIDRADGKAKVFTSGVSVYLTIKGYAENEDWGDPTKYDFTITRTEESTANYYRIVPSPNRSGLSEEEIAEIERANIDLNKIFIGGKGTNTFGEVKVGEPTKEELNQMIDEIPL